MARKAVCVASVVSGVVGPSIWRKSNEIQHNQPDGKRGQCRPSTHRAQGLPARNGDCCRRSHRMVLSRVGVYHERPNIQKGARSSKMPAAASSSVSLSVTNPATGIQTMLLAGTTGSIAAGYAWQHHPPYQRRASCCRYYLLPQGSLCASCPLVSDEERLAKNLDWMREQLSKKAT